MNGRVAAVSNKSENVAGYVLGKMMPISPLIGANRARFDNLNERPLSKSRLGPPNGRFGRIVLKNSATGIYVSFRSRFRAMHSG